MGRFSLPGSGQYGCVEYSKPHLAYDKQVELLASRGMDVGPMGDAVHALKRIGYYRLSAYTYPMRVRGDQVNHAASLRRDEFVSGARLKDAVALHDFDHRLRRTLLPAIQTLEIGLRTKVAYQLSKRDPMGHLSKVGLDQVVCESAATGPDHAGTKYEVWRREYDSLQHKSKHEDYVRHFTLKYDGRVPIWAACEFMTMGSLTRLYRLLEPKDAGRIAAELGVKNKDVLFGWIKALNVTRNNCAHNARVWNRSTIYPPDRINERMVGPALHHLVDADRNKVYFLAAVLGYLLHHIDPDSRFTNDFRTTMNKFPSVLGMTPQNTMGFSEDWQDQDLWRLQ